MIGTQIYVALYAYVLIVLSAGWQSINLGAEFKGRACCCGSSGLDGLPGPYLTLSDVTMQRGYVPVYGNAWSLMSNASAVTAANS